MKGHTQPQSQVQPRSQPSSRSEESKPCIPHVSEPPPAGPGRAGKYGELSGQSGGWYQGEVLAGRPHGHGYYSVPKVRLCKPSSQAHPARIGYWQPPVPTATFTGLPESGTSPTS